MPRINLGTTRQGSWDLRAIDGYVHYPDWNWAHDNNGIGPGTTIKATHVQDLRNVSKAFKNKMIHCACTCDCTCTCECTCTCQCTCTCNFCFG